MTDERLRQLRHLHRQDRSIPHDLYEVLRQTAGRFVGLRLLPPSYAPYGQWNAEAVDEILQSWLADRLLGRGHLQRMLDQAVNARGLRAMLERSLRQHLIAQKARSQLGNTYRRALNLLETDDETFTAFAESARRHQTYWGLAVWDEIRLFADDEVVLLAHAWSLGEFTVVRYRSDARKLPPVLPGDELKRFIQGMLGAVGECLTLAQLMRVIERRFDLGEVAIEDLASEQAESRRDDATEEIGLREVAVLLLAELTQRQSEIVVGLSENKTLEQLADALGCSQATVFNEEKRINALISREAEDPAEARELLKMIADLLYNPGGDG